MFQKNSICNRILTVCMALAFLPVLLSVSTTLEPSGGVRSSSAAHAELQGLAEFLCSEEFLPLRPAHVYRSHTGRGLTAPRHFQLWFRQFGQQFLTVCILYLTLRLFGEAVTLTRRYIIRYIHDQDGRKGAASVF